jgi:hypothetical protein
MMRSAFDRISNSRGANAVSADFGKPNVVGAAILPRLLAARLSNRSLCGSRRLASAPTSAKPNVVCAGSTPLLQVLPASIHNRVRRLCAAAEKIYYYF